MNVSIVIPNRNGRRFLEDLLPDLRAQTAAPAEIIVVDNGSDDGSVDWSTENEVRVVRFSTNRGFAIAVNEGVKAAKGSAVLVLNNDLRIASDWLERTLPHLNNGAAFVVGKVLSASDPSRIDGTFDALCRGGTAWRCGNGQVDAPVWNVAAPVQFPPFTAVLLNKTLFQAVGGLDETFGSYLEDVDFGLRCASGGHSGWYIPEAVSWHIGSATHGRWGAATVTQIARNQVLLVARHYDRTTLRRLGWQIAVAQLLWGAVALRHGRGGAWLAGKWQGLKLFRSARGSGLPRLLLLLEQGESMIRTLQRQTGRDWYWRLYFALTA